MEKKNYSNKSAVLFDKVTKDYDEEKRRSLKLSKSFDIKLFYKYKCKIVKNIYANFLVFTDVAFQRSR
ncbi:MAG: hypothetical protein LBJ79_01490 [Endomicrobium sp.]|jgi:hypothetical protein|nr:hypothetical protein [Endomicrobium sp.]